MKPHPQHLRGGAAGGGRRAGGSRDGRRQPVARCRGCAAPWHARCPGLPVRGHTRQLPARRPGDRVASQLPALLSLATAGHSMIVRALVHARRMPPGGRARTDGLGLHRRRGRRAAAVLIVSIKRGGILLGAFDEAGTMKGFVYLDARDEGRAPDAVVAYARRRAGRARRGLGRRAQARAASARALEWGST